MHNMNTNDGDCQLKIYQNEMFLKLINDNLNFPSLFDYTYYTNKLINKIPKKTIYSIDCFTIKRNIGKKSLGDGVRCTKISDGNNQFKIR